MQLTLKYFVKVLIIFFLFSFNANSQEKFLSLKNSKVNVRYGPSLDSPIKYIYKKINLPIKILDTKENFRKIIDLKKNSGWIHISQLKKSNSFIIMEDKILFKRGSIFSKPLIKIKKGRLLLIKKCQKNWCKVKTEKYTGWINNNKIWGTVN